MSLYFDLGANRSLSNLDAEGEEKFTDKQDTLVSGENIKTINGVSVLGEGNIEVGEGGTITVNQTYDPTSSYAQSGTAVADALANSIESITQNGTISNCILEIPQNIKVTLENNVLTLKSGSKYVVTSSTYSTYTLTTDATVSVPTTQGRYVILPAGNNIVINPINQVGSGTTLPAVGEGTFLRFFKVDEFKWYNRGSTSGSWGASGVNYPICCVDVDSNGVASFAKDSNGNDMIFNGACFVGHHAVVYPNVKALNPNGIDTDGTLKSNKVTISSLLIAEMASNLRTITISSANAIQRRSGYSEVKQYDSQIQGPQYIIPQNIIIYNNVVRNETPLVFFTYDGTTVTDFTIRQPYEGARDLLTDSLQADVTTLTGYDSTQTQTLKNINGVLTWVTD